MTIIKQRVFLKAILIKEAMKKPFYAKQIRQQIESSFEKAGYTAALSEIYKSLFTLTKEGVLEEKQVFLQTNYSEGQFKKRAYVVEYSIKDMDLAQRHLELYREEMNRTADILKRYDNLYGRN